MYCSKCGKKIADDAIFCDGCGAKVGGVEKNDSHIKEGKVFKCPQCGETLPFDALKCPSCGYEIRGRSVVASVQTFFDKLNSVDDEEKKIELIKTYPIPNNREDILEFMYLATANFDAKYYATNKNKDSVASAWHSKIEQCYQKGKSMLTSQSDLARLSDLYNKSNSQTSSIIKRRVALLIGGIVLAVIGFILVTLYGESNTGIGAAGIVLLGGGIVGIVFGVKRKKTNKELEEEKIEKDKKRQEKARKKGQLEEQRIIHETIVKHEYVHNEPQKESSPTELKRELKVEVKSSNVEIMNRFSLRVGEQIIIKQNVETINEDEDYDWKVILTNKALYYVQEDGEEETERVTRIPLDSIRQAIYEKGAFLEGSYLEVYRDGATDRIDGGKKLETLQQAINERINS